MIFLLNTNFNGVDLDVPRQQMDEHGEVADIRTYVEEPGQRWGFMSVQQEVTRALADPADFADVAKGTPEWRRKTNGRARDTLIDASPAFVVRDGSYVSARWPGDAYTFALTFAAVLAERA